MAGRATQVDSENQAVHAMNAELLQRINGMEAELQQTRAAAAMVGVPTFHLPESDQDWAMPSAFPDHDPAGDV